MAGDVNDLRWRIGWAPWRVMIGVVVVCTLIGAMVDAIGPFIGLGLLGGIVVWYWGVREINNKYQPLVQQFIGESERNARRGIEVDSAELYNLTYNSGSSPPLVSPAETYSNTTIVVTETSINLNRGAKYDMESRSGVGGGTNEEIYYDQVTGVRSHQDGAFTELEIQTAGGESTRISSVATDTVDEVVSAVRQRVREIKNPGAGRGRNTDARAPDRGQSASVAAREEQPREQVPESSAAVDGSVEDESEPAREVGQGSDAERATNPLASVADAVTSRTRPADPIADELYRALSDPSPDADRLEDALADAIDRLDQTGAVVDAVESIDDPTADAQLRSAKRTLERRESPIANGLEPVFDRALDESDPTAPIEAELSETEAELEQTQREHDRIQAAAETVCREADRSGALAFRSDDTADRTRELANALESETVVLSRPDTTEGTEIGSIAADLERSVRPQSPQSRELLETLGEPASDDTASVLRSTVDSLDAYADLRASVADIGERDVRRRLDALDEELQQADGDVYRHLADRVRELEAMLERDGMTDVQLYAIYQECTFYDRTLLPRLSRSLDGGDTAADTGRLIADLEDRIDAIERDYIDVRADHNHTIPRHFLSLADDLRAEAQRVDGESPMRAVGLCSAADEVLGHVEALYERNEYSVMLRRLRG